MERLEYEVMAHVEDQLWWYVGMRRIADVWLQGLPISTILDAGCGTGGNAKWLTQYGHIVGFDYESMACDYTQQRDIPVACASISTMPFRDQSFDLVTSFDVIYHRAVADDLAALKECYRVVAPGGYLLLRVAAFEWLGGHHHQRVHGARRYTPRGLTSLVQQAGFHVQKLSCVNTVLLPLVLAQVTKERLFGQATLDHSDVELPSPLVNRIGLTALAIEASLLRIGVSLPVGVSLLCLAQRPVDGS